MDLSKIRETLSAVADERRRFDAAIEEKKREREEIEALRPTMAEVLGRFNAYVDGVCNRFTTDYNHKRNEKSGGDYITPSPFRLMLRPAMKAGGAPGQFRDILRGGGEGISDDAVIFAIAPQLKERVAEQLAAMEWPNRDGHPLEDRTKRMAKLDQEIAALESGKNELLAELQAAGLDAELAQLERLASQTALPDRTEYLHPPAV